jgi:hypothetical protein
MCYLIISINRFDMTLFYQLKTIEGAFFSAVIFVAGATWVTGLTEMTEVAGGTRVTGSTGSTKATGVAGVTGEKLW